MNIYDKRHIMYGKFLQEVIHMILTPSFHGEKCGYNGRDTAHEIACDNCEFYLVCFPDWETADPAALETTIKTASDGILKAFLRADASKDEITAAEIEIDLQIMRELYRREEARGQGINAKAILGEITHGQGLRHFLKK